MTSPANLFALDRDRAKRLFAHKTDEALVQFVTADLPADDAPSLRLTESWRTLHRCLSDGTLDAAGGEYPLNHCLLGGRQLYRGEDWIMSLKRPDMTSHIAEALAGLSEEDFRGRRESLDDADEAVEALWQDLQLVRKFYEQVAPDMNAVLFTAVR